MLFSLCHHHHPPNFSTADPDSKPIQTDFQLWFLHNTMKTGVMNIPALVRMTPCPQRLQLQTLWMGVVLTGKMAFWGDKSLTSWWCNEDRCPEHPSFCQDDHLSSKTPTPDLLDRCHLDRENDILGRQVLNKIWSCYEDRCPEHPSSCQDDPLSSQILSNS